MPPAGAAFGWLVKDVRVLGGVSFISQSHFPLAFFLSLHPQPFLTLGIVIFSLVACHHLASDPFPFFD